MANAKTTHSLARIPRRVSAAEVLDQLPEQVQRSGAARRALRRVRRLGVALDRALPSLPSPRNALASWAGAITTRFRDASRATQSSLRAGQARAALAARQVQDTLTAARDAAHRTIPEPRRALLRRARRLTHQLRDRLALTARPEAEFSPPFSETQRSTPPHSPPEHPTHEEKRRPSRSSLAKTLAALRARLSDHEEST